ncbi:PadR family transcriptional regulator [Actinomyces sp. MRS3W]|uniref:PadR family transcriptional regulator n=1 Tax=Actinomyces sp. MRS3W TaxID=2800796 RepID=UPI0028FD164A|nr:PadR family transcriptional regulator [Actinomyces sp. MRS3W]MDU0348213.1 PadR family transcriptional regulator [Actinomyces sp. MRS3W]
MLDLKILGFLAEGPLHGYELRRRIMELDGPSSRLSEGTLYPALARLEKAGLIIRTTEPGARGRPRKRIDITAAGRERLHELLRHPSETDMSSMLNFLHILAFLSQLPNAAEREAVLRRRLEILRAPAPAFFYDDEAPHRAATETDPYRLGMIRIAAASRRAEITWLEETLAVAQTTAGHAPDTSH